MESVVNNLQPRQDFDNSEMADMQNLVKVALRKQIKSVLKLMSLENRVEQSNKITQKVSQHLNMKKKGNWVGNMLLQIHFAASSNAGIQTCQTSKHLSKYWIWSEYNGSSQRYASKTEGGEFFFD